MAERVVVTLVHGTYAKKARWTQEGSRLRKAVEDAFPEGVDFRTLDWSGRNTIAARHSAARKLGDLVLEDKVPRRHFIIAHSHGGNIALYALSDPHVRQRITGIATLATPFLMAKQRDLGTLGLSVFYVGFLGWAWLAAYFMRRYIWPSAEFLPIIVGTGLFMLLAVLLVRMQLRARKVVEDLQLTRPAQGRLWIARMTGDEASELLLSGQLAATIVAQIHLFFVRAYEWAERSGAGSWRNSVWRVAGGLALAMLVWIVGNLFGVRDRSSLVLWSFIVGVGIGVLIILWGLLPQAPRVVVPYAAGFVAPLAVALPILLILPFGPSVALYSFLLEMSADATPLGTWTVHQYEPVIDRADVDHRVAPALNHSWVYDHRCVLNDLTSWMKECDALVAVEQASTPIVIAS